MAGRITREVLKRSGLDVAEAGLERFIPEEGVSAGEFVRLPIEQILGRARGNPAVIEKFNVLARLDVLPVEDLHRLALYLGRLAQDVFEETFPNDKRPQDALDIKERWLNALADGTLESVSENELSLARARVQECARETEQAHRNYQVRDGWQARVAAAWEASRAIVEVMAPGERIAISINAAVGDTARSVAHRDKKASRRLDIWEEALNYLSELLEKNE